MAQEKKINLNFDCPKGDAVFHTSFHDAFNVNPSELKNVSNEVMDLILNLHMLDDDRLIALVGELIVENTVENYLCASGKGYEREFSKSNFSLKLRSAKSLNLSPSKIFDCVEVIRLIRNDFAHNLDIKNFDSIRTDLIKELDKALFSINHPMTEEKDLRSKFVMLTFDTAAALTIYTKDVRLLNSFLRSDSFQKSLLDYSKTIESK
jgi:hypothetical protein